MELIADVLGDLDHMSAWGRGDPSHSMQVTRVAPGWPVPSLMHRRRVMADRITYVGLDVHKDTIVVAVAAGGLRGEVREYGRIANTSAALDRLLRKLGGDGMTLRFCYEAGPCGYGIQRRFDPGARLRRGRPLADPEAGGRPGQDRSAGCRQPGQAAPGRRADGGVGSGCAARGDARSGTGTARRGAQPAPGAPAALGLSVAAGMPLWPAGLDQAAS